MKNILRILLPGIILFTACERNWDEHYNSAPETVNMNVWDAIKQDADLSMFVEYMESFSFDTLFEKDAAYTLFIPSNDAMEAFAAVDTVDVEILNYLISLHFVQSNNIEGSAKVQMMAEKYALFSRLNNSSLFDGITLDFESPLYLNGKYYVMNEVAVPKPNLFEYFALTNPILKTYIEELDSIVLDKEKSRPIGFDDDGNTIYDTVAIIYNEFEDFFFPVREELRNKTATIVFPKSEDYNLALDEMAGNLGDVYQDHKDIPIDWQNDVLIPYLLEHGVFENSLTENDFIQTGAPNDTLKLKNILGDSVYVQYEVSDKYICSNGVAFNYNNFAIPDTLYKGSVRIEMEWYVKETGVDKFSWREDMTNIISSASYSPIADSIPTASNDSLVRVIFDNSFTGTYSIEMNIENLFPRKYLMVVQTNRNYGAKYDVYFNDQLIRQFDYAEYNDFQWYFPSVTGARYFYIPGKAESKWDAFAINDLPYGEATLRFEYQGKSENVLTNAFLIDYIDFIPYED